MKNAKQWAKAAGVRAIKTVAQTAAATVPTSAVVIGEVDWAMIAGASVLAGVLSLLTSVAGLPEVDEGEGVLEMAKHAREDD